MKKAVVILVLVLGMFFAVAQAQVPPQPPAGVRDKLLTVTIDFGMVNSAYLKYIEMTVRRIFPRADITISIDYKLIPQAPVKPAE